MRQLVSSGSPMEEPLGFSRACRVGNMISVSGTAPIKDGETTCVGDVYGQTKYCLELSIQAIREAGGSRLTWMAFIPWISKQLNQ